MLRKIFAGFAIIALLAGSMTLAAPSALYAHGGSGSGDDDSGSSGKGGGSSKAKGSIAAVDTGAGTVTVSDRRGALITVLIDLQTEIRKDKIKHATVHDLSVGDRVEVRYSKLTMVASRVKAKGAKVEGILTAVDPLAGTFTIAPRFGSPVQLHVAEGTKIERNDAHASLDQFVIGDLAEALYDATTLIASKVETEGI